MSQENQTEEVQYTQEQVKALRGEMLKYYTEEIKFLKKQEEFERLQADIEEHKVRKITMMHRSAQIYAQMQAAEEEAAKESSNEEVAVPEKKSRKLKTETENV